MSYSKLVASLAVILILFAGAFGGFLFWENSKLNKESDSQALNNGAVSSPETSKLPLDAEDKNINKPTQKELNNTVAEKAPPATEKTEPQPQPKPQPEPPTQIQPKTEPQPEVPKKTTAKSTVQAKDFYKVPENPDTTTLTENEKITDKPYYNIKLLGFNSAVVIDSFGNEQETVADSFLGYIEDVHVNGMGQDGASIFVSSENTYKFELYPKNYSFITIKYGFGNGAGNLMTIHYENNYKPWDGVIKFETGPKGVVAATYTKENGGKPTIITPFAAVYGKMAADETGPNVNIVGKDQGDGNVLITITATDPSGIHDIYYYLDDKVGAPLTYNGPFTINKSKITTDFRASSFDMVGNLGWSDIFDVKNLKSFERVNI